MSEPAFSQLAPGQGENPDPVDTGDRAPERETWHEVGDDERVPPPNLVTDGAGAFGGSPEEVLLRHGLVTHIATVETTNPDLIEVFSKDAARIARNVIALSQTRFGLLMDGPPTEITSEVSHRIEPVGPGDFPSQPEKQATKEEAADAQTELEERLSQIEGTLEIRARALAESWSSEAMSDQLETHIDESLARRLEAEFSKLQATIASDQQQAPARSVWDEARAEAFWDGLETALRLFHNSVARLEEHTLSTAALPGTAGRADAAALATLEETLALGMEATGSLWQSTQASVEGLTDRIASTLRPLIAQELEQRLGALNHTLPQRRTEKVSLEDEKLSALYTQMECVTEKLDRLSQNVEALQSDAERGKRNSSALIEDIGKGIEAAISNAQNEAFSGLSRDLAAKGGLLSKDIDTGLRSLKNFWVATEDAIGRLDKSLTRLEKAGKTGGALPSADGPSAASEDNLLGKLETLETEVSRLADAMTDPAIHSDGDSDPRKASREHTRELFSQVRDLLTNIATSRAYHDNGQRPQEDA